MFRKPAPCAQRAIAGDTLCAVYCRIAFDQVRRQRRIRLQHQRDRAADDRRRHARAAQRQIRLRAAPGSARRQAGTAPWSRRTCCPEPPATPCPCRARPGPAWRAKSMNVGPRRAVRRHRVVGSRQRSLGARGADRQHPGRVARRRDAAALRCAVAAFLPVLPAAATTVMPVSVERLGRQRQRVGPVRTRGHRAPTDRLTTRML